MSSARYTKNSGATARGRADAFTLLEVLVSCSILALLTLTLLSIANQANRLWATANSQNQYRQNARVALDFMATELSEATFPINQTTNTANSSLATNLQLIVDPTSVTVNKGNGDAIFWQAPVATDTAGSTNSDLAEVGYFVQWNGNTANLFRYFVNPSDSTNYLIYSSPTWVSDTQIGLVAPANTTNNNYKGLFLENVLGFWVQTYVNGVLTPSFNSRVNLGTNRVYMELSMAIADSVTAQKMVTVNGVSSILKTLSKVAINATNFCNSLNALTNSPSTRSIPGGIRPLTTKVYISNFHR